MAEIKARERSNKSLTLGAGNQASDWPAIVELSRDKAPFLPNPSKIDLPVVADLDKRDDVCRAPEANPFIHFKPCPKNSRSKESSALTRSEPLLLR